MAGRCQDSRGSLKNIGNLTIDELMADLEPLAALLLAAQEFG